MSGDKPKIRLHRYESILAVKWPDFGHWLMIWPNPYPELAPAGEPAARTDGTASSPAPTSTGRTGSTQPPIITVTSPP